MSDTPRTDAVERAHGLAWFGLNDEVGRYLDGMVKFREKAKELERDLAAAEAKLAAKPDVAGLVERLCMSKLFDVPELTAERKEAADALLSLSAQLAEEKSRLDYPHQEIADLRAQLQEKEAECEGLRQDAERLRVLEETRVTWCIEPPLGDPSRPYQAWLRAADGASCGATGKTLTELADVISEWYSRNSPAIDSAREGKP